MAHAESGLPYTLGPDPRITPVGKWLRRTKIDELPQLLNVLRGEMSLVGPRPVLPALAEEFHSDYVILLKVRPGLTDPASLKYSREAELLALDRDPMDFFKTVVTPDKLRISEDYLRHETPWSDAGLLVMTVLICVFPILGRLYGDLPAARCKREPCSAWIPSSRVDFARARGAMGDWGMDGEAGDTARGYTPAAEIAANRVLGRWNLIPIAETAENSTADEAAESFLQL